MKEFFLCPFLTRKELDVIHQQDVDGPVPLSEVYGLVVPYGVDQLVHELLRRDICQAERRIAASDQVPDRVHQVSLSETDTAINIQRIVSLGWHVGDGLG